MLAEKAKATIATGAILIRVRDEKDVIWKQLLKGKRKSIKKY